MNWFKKLKEAKAKEKAIEEKIKNDDYLQRLRNSYKDFSGMKFSNRGAKDKKYLKISEFESLLREELKRKLAE